ncbi:endosomal cargo receptor [Coccidioides immitis RS]|uniref:Endosomal cargo receptor n=7 Tax=Coccidioides TaxID=5500 RepID=J3KCP7_COCIM|nr:endosomal cargo receptor [Coccidioides immitis RS]XP_003068313.1 emp24/gp25L/p24 family protein [Coccidioides posadasii C735 delta SOWgp]EFW20036.1 endosomal cargo receptor Erp5 [Coccidioides posadasii str. Silveira]KMM73393.1 transmembrane emp24 domain-containing protein 9 [Coccidioides posadasii RMSCC 3488]KMP08317.1 transmembrane emp24 domain-containing protein 9 [Coccidioides immitis RMSCC 2394]KMU72425.1 transmembrane emp24 domain -containing protein 9 [Coccidioides immitis RMSCC 3703]|eukprot:XP_003068313.1 emp24/gp25L/p24 family protein [Coccidioides posadasii C735 delta SOWgp]
MALSRSRPSWLSTFFTLATVLMLSTPSHAIYFYIFGREAKCFYEELPQGTLVVGTYSAESYNDKTGGYSQDPNLGIMITVEETFDNDHRVVSQRGGDKGRLTFSAADAGLHRICFTPEYGGNNGWFSSGGAVKLTIDIATGESSKLESEDRGKMEDMAQRVKNLNARLQDIRREQVFQREREAQFRDQSEATNSRVVRWTLIQLAVLTATCVWQLSHLRSFFIKQKLT